MGKILSGIRFSSYFSLLLHCSLSFTQHYLHSPVIVPSLVLLLSCKGLRLLLGAQKMIQSLQPIPPGPCPDCPQEGAAFQGHGHRRLRQKRAGQLWGLQGQTGPGPACRELASSMQRVCRAWLEVAAQEKVFNARSIQPGGAICSPQGRDEGRKGVWREGSAWDEAAWLGQPTCW